MNPFWSRYIDVNKAQVTNINTQYIDSCSERQAPGDYVNFSLDHVNFQREFCRFRLHGLQRSSSMYLQKQWLGDDSP
jgi:hypothetical protein